MPRKTDNIRLEILLTPEQLSYLDQLRGNLDRSAYILSILDHAIPGWHELPAVKRRGQYERRNANKAG